MQKKSSGAGCNGGGRTRTAEAYIGAGRSRSGNGDAGSGKVGLDFTKPGKAAAGFRGKTVVCCLIREGERTGTVAEGVVSVVYGSGSRNVTSEVENPVIGSQMWKSGGDGKAR